MKKLLISLSLGVTLAAGFIASGAANSNRADNYAVPSFTCNQPASVSITNFPNNGKQNEVDNQVLVNGVKIQSFAVKFVGSSPNPNPWKSSVVVTGGNTYEVISDWNSNTVKGHEDSGVQKPVGCVTTTTVPTTTSTPTTSTVYSTTTTPAPAAVTSTVVSTTTVKSTPKIVPGKNKVCHPTKPKVVIKWHKPKVIVKWKNHPLTKAEKCVSVSGNSWINGKCGGFGKG